MNVPGVSTEVAKHSCAVWTHLALSVDSPRAGGPERWVLHCEILGFPPRCLLGSLTQNPQSFKSERAPVCRVVRASRAAVVSLLLQNRDDSFSPQPYGICNLWLPCRKRGAGVTALHIRCFWKRRDVGEAMSLEWCRAYQTRFASVGSLTSSAMSMKTNLSLVVS